MPFTKETAKKLGSKGGKAAKYNRTQWENVVGWLIGDGGIAFKDKIIELSKGRDLSKPEKEFLQHYKDLLEYHQPKLARTEMTGKDGGAITVNTIAYEYNNSSQLRAKDVSVTVVERDGRRKKESVRSLASKSR